jgi:hypothetical protein
MLDGASPSWVSTRFDITEEQANQSWDYAKAIITKHFADRGEDIEDYDHFISDHVEDVLRLLISWVEILERPVIIPALPDDDKSDGQKESTDQGESES